MADLTRKPGGGWSWLVLGLGAFGVVATLGMTRPTRADDDDAEARELNERVVRENCLICHSAELITTNRLTPKQWTAEVEKMVGWGAPLSKEQEGPLAAFLAVEYPVGGKVSVIPRMDVTEVAGHSDRVEGIARGVDQGLGSKLYQKNCANCHAENGQGADLGPNLVEKPALLRPSEFAGVILKGRGRMPGFAGTLREKDCEAMLAWLRGRIYQPPTVAK